MYDSVADTKILQLFKNRYKISHLVPNV